MYFLPILGGIFYQHLLSTFDLWYNLTLMFLCWFFVEWPIFQWEWGIEATTTTFLGTSCAFMSSSVCFMKLYVPVFGSYMFISVICSWWSSPCVSMKWPPFCLPITLVWSLFCQVWVQLVFLLSRSICLEHLFLTFNTKSVFVFANEGHFLQAANHWTLFSNQIHTLCLFLLQEINIYLQYIRNCVLKG
jgi:hypothetical protein